MGGTIHKLVQQNHDVHVAYETSGNIAVGDEEVTRFMHFINGFNPAFADSKDSIISNKYKKSKTFFARRRRVTSIREISHDHQGTDPPW